MCCGLILLLIQKIIDIDIFKRFILYKDGKFNDLIWIPKCLSKRCCLTLDLCLNLWIRVCVGKTSNPFYARGLFFYSLRTPCFQGIQKETRVNSKFIQFRIVIEKASKLWNLREMDTLKEISVLQSLLGRCSEFFFVLLRYKFEICQVSQWFIGCNAKLRRWEHRRRWWEWRRKWKWKRKRKTRALEKEAVKR